jgi:hypothetical protein
VYYSDIWMMAAELTNMSIFPSRDAYSVYRPRGPPPSLRFSPGPTTVTATTTTTKTTTTQRTPRTELARAPGKFKSAISVRNSRRRPTAKKWPNTSSKSRPSPPPITTPTLTPTQTSTSRTTQGRTPDDGLFPIHELESTIYILFDDN